jgi:hypothetical protein
MQFSRTTLVPNFLPKALVCLCIFSVLFAQFLIPADSSARTSITCQNETMDFPEDLPTYRFQPVLVPHHDQPSSGSAFQSDPNRTAFELDLGGLWMQSESSALVRTETVETRTRKVPLWLWNCCQLI